MSDSGPSLAGTGRQAVAHVDPTCLTLAEQFDVKINAHYAEIRKLCASRNSQCSATRKLPAEVLSMVFRELSTGIKRQGRSPSWIYVTHVCHAWRAAALDEPTLWNNTIGLSKRWLKLCLHRAAAVPLNVVYPHLKDEPSYYDIPCSDSYSSSSSSSSSSPVQCANDMLEDLFDTPERLGELTLDVGSANVINRITRPAPFLSDLQVQEGCSLPSNFLSNNAPCLRAFASNGCAFPAEATWLRNLRTLVLLGHWGFKDNGGNVAPITTASFLSLINPLERLENLTVHFPPNPILISAHQDYTGGVIRFPSLRTAEFRFLSESSSHLANLFTHVLLPSIHSLCVVWPHSPSHEDGNKLFTSFLANCCLPFRHIVWTASEIRLSTDLASGAPTCTFKYISLSSSEELPFQDLETVEELDIRDIRTLSSLLTSAALPVPYPSLKQISLDSSMLRPIRLTPTPEERKPKYMINLLKRWLKERKAPHNLEKLVISGSQYVTDKDIQAFQKFVPVTWIRDKSS